MNWKTRLVLYGTLWLSYGFAFAASPQFGAGRLREFALLMIQIPVYYFMSLRTVFNHSFHGILIVIFLFLHAWSWFRSKKFTKLVLLMVVHFLGMFLSGVGIVALLKPFSK